jgi:hypothetical protein
MQRHNFATASRMGDNRERPAHLIGKLGDTIEFDANQHQIIGSKRQSRAAFVDAVTASLSAVFNKKSNNLVSKVHVLASMFDAVKNRCASIMKWAGRDRLVGIQGKTKGKFEFTTHGGNTADNIGAINRTAIPDASGNHGCFNPN